MVIGAEREIGGHAFMSVTTIERTHVSGKHVSETHVSGTRVSGTHVYMAYNCFLYTFTSNKIETLLSIWETNCKD